MTYGAKTGAVRKAQMGVAEMRMSRLMCDVSTVTKMDRIRNETIRRAMKVGEIAKKVQETRLKWYRHVMRRGEEYVGKE